MKKNVIFAVFLCGTAAMLPLRADAGEEPAATPAVSTAAPENTPAGESFSIRVKAVPLSSLLDIISQRAHASFSIADPELAEWRLTMLIKNVRLNQALEILQKTKGLDFERVGSADNFIVRKSTIPPQEFPPLTQQDLADPVLKRLVTVRVKDVPLARLLDVISEQAGISFIITGEMRDVRITSFLEKVTIVDVFQFLKARGFSVSRMAAADLFIVRQTPGAGEDSAAKPAVSAATPENPGFGEPFDIALKGAPLSTLFDVLSQHSHASFSIGADLAERKFTIFIKNVRLNQVLEILQKTKDLDFERVGTTDNFIVRKSTRPPQEFLPLTQQDLADPVLNRLVTVRVKNAPLTSFLEVISEQARVNFIVTSGFENTRITAFLKKVTIVDVLQFLKARGCSASRVTGTDLFIIRQTAGAPDGFSDAEGKFGDKKYEEAVTLYKELADKYPDSEMADYALLMTAINYDWIAARDSDPSVLKREEETLKRLIHDYPKSTRLGDAYLYLGQIYSGYGGAKTQAIDCKKAVEFYNLAIKSTYRDWVKAQAETRIAQCYERGGEKNKALEIYKRIIKQYPGAAITEEVRQLLKGEDPLFETGLNLEKQKEYGLAIAVYKRIAVKASLPQSVRKAELRIGVCQSAMGDVDPAVKTFEAYFAKYNPGPDDAVYFYMGQALENAGRKEEARKYLNKAKIAVKPKI
ncbi:MAG: tetratricopeptide repeat protein [Elusimicrobia bacterium]|nr:tetratricopeptide repeat protein [Elusimicrobiota bacterium]